MKKIDFEYDYALQHPYNLFDGAIVRKQSCKEKPTKNSEIITTWYKVKIRHDARIFEQIEESEVPTVENNLAGDYMLNVRTGYISIMLDRDRVSVPLNHNPDAYQDILKMLRRAIRYD